MYALDIYVDGTDVPFVPCSEKVSDSFPPLEPNEDHLIMRLIRCLQEIYTGAQMDFPSDVCHFWIGKWGDKGSYIPDVMIDSLVNLLHDAGLPFASICVIPV